MGHNTTIASRWFREVWVEDGERTIDELMHRDAVGYMEGFVINGSKAFKDARRTYLETFPDLAITAEDIIEQDDKVVVRWSVKATHKGAGLGIPPTHRHVSFRGITWLEIRDGRIVRGWDSWNLGGLLASLAKPEP